MAPRYLGEEEDGSVPKESRSQALLAKLQQKAKEKQKQSVTERRRQPLEEQTEQQGADKDSSQEPQHPKKRKSEVAPLCVSDYGNHDEPDEKKKKSKRGATEKQKKKKKKDQSGVCFFLVYTHILTPKKL